MNHNPKQFYIVFSPDGEAPPVVVHHTHKGALWAAYDMAKKRPGQTFYVMASASRPCVAAPAEEPAEEVAQ